MESKNNLLVFIGLSIIFSISVLTTSATDQVIGYEPVVNPRTFIIETNSLSDRIDPAINYDIIGRGINEQVCETLVDFEGNSTFLHTRLATDWSMSDDGLEWTFKLRQGVMFTDGTPFNAWVMKYSLDRVIMLNWNPARIILNYIKGTQEFRYPIDANVSEALTYLSYHGVRVIDDFTLKINISSTVPLDYILQNRAACAVSPKFVIEHRPQIYTMYNGSLTEDENTSAMMPLNKWFPNLTDWTKLGLPADHDPLDSGVVPNSYPQTPTEHIYYADHLVGTGPYKYVSFTDWVVELEKNNNWWNKHAFHQNSLDKIIWKVVGESGTRLQDMRAGTNDYTDLFRTQFIEVLANENDTINQPLETLDPGISAFLQDSSWILTLSFNMNDSLPLSWVAENPSNSFYNVTHDMNNTVDPTDDVPRILYRYADSSLGEASPENPCTSILFRKAFALSLDIEKLILAERNGLGIQPSGVIPRGIFGHVDNLKKQGYIPEFDSERAKALFKQVGWRGTLAIRTYPGTFEREIARSLKEVVEGNEIGISINILDPPWAGGWVNNPPKNLPFEFSVWSSEYSHAHDYVTRFYHGNDGDYAKKYHYNNSLVNELIDKVAIEPDPVKKAEMYRWIEQNATQDYPIIYTIQEVTPRFYRSWIQNVEDSGSLHPIRSTPVIYALGKPDFWNPNQLSQTQTITTKTIHPTTISTIESSIENNIDKILTGILANLTTIALAGSVGSLGGLLLAIVVRRGK